jgi:4-hydroxy-2-oxoheptanedioate aldolase
MTWQEIGQPRFGAWLHTDSAEIAAELIAAGYDYVGIDCQHSLISPADAGRLLREFAGSATKAAVRVPSHASADIGKVLDAGADIVIVPMVSTAQEAAVIARASRLPPDGDRSFGPIRRDMPRQAGDINSRVTCLAMIETAEGVVNVDEIVSIDGIDGIYVGPKDLSLSLGLSETLVPPSPELLSAVRGLAQSARRAGKIAGFHAGAGENAHHYLACGFTLVTLADDSALIRSAAASDLSAARSASTRQVPTGQVATGQVAT